MLAYRATAPSPGDYELWVRVNPVQARLAYRVNGAAWAPVELGSGVRDSTNVAGDGKPDLRFLAWARAGTVGLKKGENTVEFRMDSPNSNHGYLDCFVLTRVPFRPAGTLKPGQVAGGRKPGWFAFDPPPDRLRRRCGLRPPRPQRGDRRRGRVHRREGRAVRPHQDREARAILGGERPGRRARGTFRAEARTAGQARGEPRADPPRLLRRQGRQPRPREVREAHEVVAAMKAEGIYSHFSIYFPLWLDPAPANRTGSAATTASTYPFAAPLFQPRLPGEIPRLVEGPADDARPEHRQATRRRPGRHGPGDP